MMRKAELIKLANKYQNKADRAYRNHQETGITRYDNERRKAEDLADALNIAANAVEDHDKMIALRVYLSRLVNMANALAYVGESRLDKEREKIIKEIIAIGKLEDL